MVCALCEEAPKLVYTLSICKPVKLFDCLVRGRENKINKLINQGPGQLCI